MKYLDTFELWNRLFKISCGDNNNFTFWIYDNTYNMKQIDSFSIEKTDLENFIKFLHYFIKQS